MPPLLHNLKPSSKTCCNVRLAQLDEGPLVGDLVKRYGGPSWDWLDWSTCTPFWLIGEVDGEPRGVIMVQVGKPFATMDFLFVDPTLTTRQRAVLSRDLCYAGWSTCKQYGAQAVYSFVTYTDESWEQIAVKRGAKQMAFGTSLMKRVQ